MAAADLSIYTIVVDRTEKTEWWYKCYKYLKVTIR